MLVVPLVPFSHISLNYKIISIKLKLTLCIASPVSHWVAPMSIRNTAPIHLFDCTLREDSCRCSLWKPALRNFFNSYFGILNFLSLSIMHVTTPFPNSTVSSHIQPILNIRTRAYLFSSPSCPYPGNTKKPSSFPPITNKRVFVIVRWLFN